MNTKKCLFFIVLAAGIFGVQTQSHADQFDVGSGTADKNRFSTFTVQPVGSTHYSLRYRSGDSRHHGYRHPRHDRQYQRRHGDRDPRTYYGRHSHKFRGRRYPNRHNYRYWPYFPYDRHWRSHKRPPYFWWHHEEF